MPDLAAVLPPWPPPFGQAVMFGGLLIAGLLAGEALRRLAALPRITGYVLAGIALGPSGTGLLDSNALYDLRLLVDLSIGLIMFELGFRIDLAWLRTNRALYFVAAAESLVAFWAIYAALAWLGFRPLLAATAAAIGTATSPAVVMLVSHELRSEGQLTERMLLLTAVNVVFAYVVLTLLLPFLHLEQQAHWRIVVLHPLYVLAGSALCGALSALVLLALARWVGKEESRQFVLLVAVVVLTIGIAHGLKLSVALALVVLGAFARNRDRAHALLPLRFGHGGQLFFVILFVLTGASLEFHALVPAAGAVTAFIGVRFLGKGLALALFGGPSGIDLRRASLLALALMPMSGLAVIMVRDTVSLYPAFGAELAAIVLSAVMVLELAGPVATQFALRRAGEARPGA